MYYGAVDAPTRMGTSRGVWPIEKSSPDDYFALSPLFITIELLVYRWVQNISPHKLWETAGVSTEEKREFHLALSPEISLLRDFVAPILL